MKRFALVVMAVLVLGVALNGCVSISKYTPPKGDEDKPVMKMGGMGKEQPKVKVDVELLEKPDFSKFSAPRTQDNEVNGNRGVFEGGTLMLRKNFQSSEASESAKEQPKVWWSTMSEESQKPAAEEPSQEMQAPKETKPAVTTYKVKKGQTLADISKEVYGDAKKWRIIYKANKAKLKSYDKIYAGQVLDIPADTATPSHHHKHHKKAAPKQVLK